MSDYLTREELRVYDRHMFRSTLVSLFWNVIIERKKRSGGFKLQNLADALGISKSTVSRWFSSSLPNWEADTVSDIACALNLDLRIMAIDRADGTVYHAPYRSEKAVIMWGNAPPVTSSSGSPSDKKVEPNTSSGYGAVSGTVSQVSA